MGFEAIRLQRKKAIIEYVTNEGKIPKPELVYWITNNFGVLLKNARSMITELTFSHKSELEEIKDMHKNLFIQKRKGVPTPTPKEKKK